MGMESGLVHAYQFSLRGRSRSLLPNQDRFSNARMIVTTSGKALRIEKHIYSCAYQCQLYLLGNFFVF